MAQMEYVLHIAESVGESSPPSLLARRSTSGVGIAPVQTAQDRRRGSRTPVGIMVPCTEPRALSTLSIRHSQRGKPTYTEEPTHDIKKTRPEAIFPPPTPRAEFSTGQPSKDAEHPQPRANAWLVPA